MRGRYPLLLVVTLLGAPAARAQNPAEAPSVEAGWPLSAARLQHEAAQILSDPRYAAARPQRPDSAPAEPLDRLMAALSGLSDAARLALGLACVGLLGLAGVQLGLLLRRVFAGRVPSGSAAPGGWTPAAPSPAVGLGPAREALSRGDLQLALRLAYAAALRAGAQTLGGPWDATRTDGEWIEASLGAPAEGALRGLVARSQGQIYGAEPATAEAVAAALSDAERLGGGAS